MNTYRRDFIKTTGIAGVGIIAGGLKVLSKENVFNVLFPLDGDMLTGNDGVVKEGSLLTRIKISGPQGSNIRVNGTKAKYDGKIFQADVLLKDYKNEIIITEKRSGSRQAITVYWLRNILGKYRFSLDDNIWFLKDINDNSATYRSIFDNAYLSFLKQVHDTFGTKIHMNIYYQTEGFNLSQMTDKYKSEWKDNAGWLRLNFHALQNDPDRPYLTSGYDEVKRDCEMVKEQIGRFAGEEVMGPVTTLHWGAGTLEGCRALRDCGYKALSGYFVVEPGKEPVSYYLDSDKKHNLSKRIAWKDNREDIIFSRINIVINSFKLNEIVPYLDDIKKDPQRSAYMDVMIHEQYFHPSYSGYQPDFREKVMTTMKWVAENGYKPAFLSEVLFNPNIKTKDMERKFIYEVKLLTGSMKIDADWSKKEWQNIKALEINNYLGPRPGFLPEAKSKMMYDNENLYLIFHVNDKFVRCVTNKINGPVWEDSCVEFFFAPDSGFPLKYFNLEMNCGGTPLMHYNIVPRKEIVNLDTSDIQKVEIAHTLPGVIDPEMKEEVSWTVEYRIPLAILRKYSNITSPGPGVVWKANFYKCAENNSNPNYLTWAVINNPVPDFHLPQFFGEIRFL